MAIKLSILTDNNTKRDSHLLAEHGLSLHIECDNIKSLFDTGDTDVYLKNAAKMGIDLQAIDLIALSHHHYDHVGGLKYFPVHKNRKIKLVAQKYAFYPCVDYPNNLAKHEIIDNFDVISVDSEPLELSENLIFLGTIPRITDFETTKKFGNFILPSGELMNDFCEDDTALIYKSSEGIVVITGCSHSGICNIIQYAIDTAEKKWGISKVKTVIGGLHLINSPPDFLAKVIDFLHRKGISEIYPCHCTDLNAKIALACGGLKVHEVGVGTTLDFN
ncbi:MAG: MBL fold metallo-hydrolase [Alphaproteobacteria bacterium]|nr:MBL fold metallo-hydrolase [Alphaproteobacteria bacterium]